MKRVGLIISLLFFIMILSCWGCGKKRPPVLPQGHASVSVSENGGEGHAGFRHFDGNQPDL
jgi:predicted small lipoprotein YifL